MFVNKKIKSMFEDDDPKLFFFLDNKGLNFEDVYKDHEDLIEKSIKHFKNQIAETAITYSLNLNHVNELGQTYLMIAIEHNNFKIFKKLIDMEIQYDMVDANRESALFYAIRQSNFEYFDQLMKKDVDLKGYNLNGENLATYAYLHGKKDLAEFLITNGIFINHMDKDGNTIMHHALIKLDVESAMKFIDYGADLFARNYQNQTCFDLAIKKGVDEVLVNKMHEMIDQLFAEKQETKLLELMEENQDVEDYEAFNVPFLIAKLAVKYNHKSIFDRIMRNRALLSSVDYKGKSLLMYCVELGQFVFARKIIYLGGNLNLKDRENKTILFTVLEQLNNTGTTQTIKDELKIIFNELIECHVDVNVKDHLGNTLLMNAIINKQASLIDQLINYTDCDLTLKNEEGKNVLLLAYEAQDFVTVNKLIQSQRADINVLDVNHESIMLHALKNDHLDLFVALLQNGADLNIQYKEGLTILMVAISQGKIRFAAKIFEYPFDVDIQDDSGKTALMHAVKIKNIKVVEALLRCGASTTICDYKNDDPILYAIDQEAFDIAKLLRDFKDQGNDWRTT